jgi:hypothetical protein
MTTGNVSHAKILKGWFVMLKDSKNSHPDNKLWGDGWGWSWFDAAAPSKTTSQIAKWIAKPAMYRRELPIGSMSKVIPR